MTNKSIISNKQKQEKKCTLRCALSPLFSHGEKLNSVESTPRKEGVAPFLTEYFWVTRLRWFQKC